MKNVLLTFIAAAAPAMAPDALVAALIAAAGAVPVAAQQPAALPQHAGGAVPPQPVAPGSGV
jgi:hypothetical protein